MSDGSRCGMSNQVMVRLQVAAVVEDWKGRLPSSGGGDESANGGSGFSGECYHNIKFLFWLP